MLSDVLEDLVHVCHTQTPISGDVFALTFSHLDESNLWALGVLTCVFLWDMVG